MVCCLLRNMIFITSLVRLYLDSFKLIFKRLFFIVNPFFIRKNTCRTRRIVVHVLKLFFYFF
jgi:hypothetical protein